MLRGLSVPNGMAWSPDGATFYLIDSPEKRVRCFPFDESAGELGVEGDSLDLSSAPGFPDGCAMDVEGKLWVAHWAGACITCWDTVTKKLLYTVEFPTNNITSCAFGGAALTELFVTSALKDLTNADKQSQPCAGALFHLSMSVPGLPASTARIL